ncbi:hypothetical protein JCM8097_005891 [Rhodosporidiobolus ruineniae]
MPHAFADVPDPLLSPPAFGAPTSSSSGRGPLHSGATFAGVQRSGRNSYDVIVKLDHVDVESGRVCGTLEIKGLTTDLDKLVTFFDGEIVGEPGLPGFRTGKYGATEVDDMKHWRRFPAFTRNRLEHQLVKPDLNLQCARNKPFLFMRWKERFLVPNHRQENIHGASYSGFYYVCLDCSPSPSAETVHRGISPVARPSLSGRRTSSSTTRGLSTQTVAHPPLPAASSSAPTVSTPRPAPPRRASSGSFSYAAAVRGDPPSPSASSSPSFSDPSSSPSSSLGPRTPPAAQEDAPMAPPPTEVPTPKNEVDLSIFAEPSSSSSTSPLEGAPQLPPVATFSPFASPAVPTDPAFLPVSFFHPSTGAPAPSSSLALAGTASGRDDWPPPTSPPPLRALRRMSTDVATVLAKTRGRAAIKRRESQVDVQDEFGQDEDYGLKSWTDATISGFYFHHSASPYQELSLRYVPTSMGGSSEFAFR